MQARRPTFRTIACRWLAAPLLLAAAGAAHAALFGIGITPAQQKLVTVGMSADEVRQALGRPAQVLQFRNEPGPTWTYDVHTAPTGGPDLVVFDVDFGTSGRVVSARERPVEHD